MEGRPKRDSMIVSLVIWDWVIGAKQLTISYPVSGSPSTSLEKWSPHSNRISKNVEFAQSASFRLISSSEGLFSNRSLVRFEGSQRLGSPDIHIPSMAGGWSKPGALNLVG